jgi:hypothetical protein
LLSCRRSGATITNNPNAIAIVLVNFKTAISVSNFEKKKSTLNCNFDTDFVVEINSVLGSVFG